MKEPVIIDNLVHKIRGIQVMLDTDLAALYEIPVMALNQAVKRNAERFPSDFMFQLTPGEARMLKSGIFNTKTADLHGLHDLKSQIVISNRGGRRNPPFAFITSKDKE